jgi:hypothetical protein
MINQLERDEDQTEEAGFGKLYHIYLNGRFSCALAIPDITAYMEKFFPGAGYEVYPNGEIHITASEPQLEEITRFRYRYYVGD